VCNSDVSLHAQYTKKQSFTQTVPVLFSRNSGKFFGGAGGIGLAAKPAGKGLITGGREQKKLHFSPVFWLQPQKTQNIS